MGFVTGIQLHSCADCPVRWQLVPLKWEVEEMLEWREHVLEEIEQNHPVQP